MPLDSDPLPAEEIKLIERWIAEGAVWPGQSDADAANEAIASGHWSLRPVVKPDVPKHAVADGNPVDAFILAELQKKNLGFNPPADPRTLIRRVSIVLTGLPPLPDEVDAFLESWETDSDPAYERLIDGLLESPHFGERWAQHWLDVIRWAESSGSESNYYRKNAWYYRDYVIRAFNEDKPYDQFLKDQIAGDAFGEDAATGFLVSGPHVPGETVGRQEAAKKQARADRLNEILQTVGTATLATTIGCARCHNHKFDPLTIRDYYSMVAVFQDIEFDHRVPKLPDDHPRARAGREIMQKIERLRAQIAKHGSWDENWVDHRKVHFAPHRAEKVRITFLAKSVYLDEIEIHTARSRDTNISQESVVRTSKKAENPAEPSSNLVDGRHTSFWGWKSKLGESDGNPWVEIELTQPAIITRVDISSNRFPHYATNYIEGFQTRVPNSGYRIEVFDNGTWVEVAKKEAVKNEAVKKGIDEVDGLAKRFVEEGPQPIFAGRFRNPVATYVLHRGDPMSPRDEVVPAALSVISGDLKLDAKTTGPQRRLAFANWLADPSNPLTARVMVNRLWHHTFGTGIVSTPGDFGRAGAMPSHTDLLDWLAATFMEDGWSVKKMLRRMMMTRTFRQASTPREEALAIDADSRLFWRFPPRRVEAEVLRDSILAIAGTLNRKIGGPSYRIHNVKKRFQQWTVVDNHGPHTWRRMLYQERMRGIDDRMFSAFDFPDCGQIRGKRPVSTTPLQALNLMNGKLISIQSAKLAERIMREADDKAVQVDEVFERILGRPPSSEERNACLELVGADGLEALARTLFNTNEFAFLN